MAAGMLGAAVFVAVFFAAYFGVAVLSQRLTDRPGGERRRAARRLRDLSNTLPLDDADAGTPVNWLREAVLQLGRQLMPRAEDRAAALQLRLVRAGYRHPAASQYFSASRLVLAVALAAASALTGLMLTIPWSLFTGAVLSATAVGYITPSLVLGAQVHKRQRLLRKALPDALDILVLSVEGGVSVSAALVCVTEEIQAVHPLLGTELEVVHKQMQLGLSAGDAFREFADRCGLLEARDLAAALSHADRYGASIARALRIYAESARHDYQLWVEEMAQKASVKIIFPMLLCIFPAMFIVLLGPAAFQLSRLFAD